MELKRAVITGLGAISPIGIGIDEIKNSLVSGKSGITSNPEYKEMGMKSEISGSIDLILSELIDRKLFRFMGETAAYSYLSAQEAIKDSNLPEEIFNSDRVGIIAGSGGASSRSQVEAADIAREKGIKRIGPYRVTQTMGSTVSACLATFLGIKGINYSISSACSTSAHCIGSAWEQIQLGKQDIVLAGGGEDEHWTQSALFDAMGALSSKFNSDPEAASRPFDKGRDGFVISAGGGIVILEELGHARKRGAKIYGEIVGYSATSDGEDMVSPSGLGAAKCMKQALQMSGLDTVDYLNAHGTSTPAGDPTELEAIKKVFERSPIIGSTKSQTGHALGAAGVLECIYSILMLKNKFIAESLNLEDPIEEAVNLKFADQMIEKKDFYSFMSNSFGFGGTNASIVVKEFTD
ncbi:MAG: beta-ketoacyl synthase N-terminal-like domain-containing protein [Gammaproteobacteria bacterium]